MAIQSVADIWVAISEECKSQISEAAYTCFLKDIKPEKIEDGYFIVSHSNEYMCTIIEQNYTEIMNGCIKKIMGIDLQFKIIFDQEEEEILRAETLSEGLTFEDFFKEVRAKYPDQLFMADTSCFEEGKLALELGFDLIGTTMSGYTPYTKGTPLPDFTLMKRYKEELGATVIAEGGIWAPDELVKAFESGAYSAVVGTAITRPMDITKRFVKALEDSK